MPANIDLLPTQRSMIDLGEAPKNSFNSVLYGYRLRQVFDDVLLVKYVDETDDGTVVRRGGLYVPINVDTKAWRVGVVILAGTNVKNTKVGDHVIFPNNLGIPISNIEVEGQGTLKKGIFLNEQRVFGTASVIEGDNENIASILKNTTAK